jgi:hypothetical protein
MAEGKSPGIRQGQVRIGGAATRVVGGAEPARFQIGDLRASGFTSTGPPLHGQVKSGGPGTPVSDEPTQRPDRGRLLGSYPKSVIVDKRFSANELWVRRSASGLLRWRGCASARAPPWLARPPSTPNNRGPIRLSERGPTAPTIRHSLPENQRRQHRRHSHVSRARIPGVEHCRGNGAGSEVQACKGLQVPLHF